MHDRAVPSPMSDTEQSFQSVGHMDPGGVTNPRLGCRPQQGQVITTILPRVFGCVSRRPAFVQSVCQKVAEQLT